LVGCGMGHTVVGTRGGLLFAFGSNDKGQLGVGNITEGDTNFVATPSTVKIKAQPWRTLSCGYDHTAVLSATGELFTWGSNEEGQLGHKLKKGSAENHLCIPTQLKCPGGKRESVQLVACGSRHTILVDTKGVAWSFGETEDGKLGVQCGKKEDTKATPAQVCLSQAHAHLCLVNHSPTHSHHPHPGRSFTKPTLTDSLTRLTTPTLVRGACLPSSPAC
jgi:X-linked retinitis pigmentosa GTPase regulator